MRMESVVTQKMILSVQEKMMKNRRTKSFEALEKDYYKRGMKTSVVVGIMSALLLVMKSQVGIAFMGAAVLSIILFNGLYFTHHLSSLLWLLNKKRFRKQIDVSAQGRLEFERAYIFEDDTITIITQNVETKLNLDLMDRIDETLNCDVYFVQGEAVGLVFTNFTQTQRLEYDSYKDKICETYGLERVSVE